jgi:hypothetical protein
MRSDLASGCAVQPFDEPICVPVAVACGPGEGSEGPKYTDGKNEASWMERRE